MNKLSLSKKSFKSFIFTVFILFAYSVFSQNNDSLMSVLDNEIHNNLKFQKKKNIELHELIDKASKIELSGTSEEIYNSYLKLYEGYKTFKYDSAYYFLEKAKDIAINTKDSKLINHVKVDESFILLSAGLFTEALDTLKSINSNELDAIYNFKFHFTKARTFFDLADYSNDERFRIKYTRKGIDNLKLALKNVDGHSSENLLASGLLELKMQNWKNARDIYLNWINAYELSPENYGIATSSLSYIYSEMNEEEKSIKYLAVAALSDLRNAITENIALRILATKLYKKGDLERANKYVKTALSDANFYNARHRVNQISTILPIIESAQLYRVEQKNNNLQKTIFLLIILTFIILVFSFIIYKQLKEKKTARNALNENNKKLQQMNLNLIEADTIKQDYITYFLKATSDLINKMGSLQKAGVLKIRTKKPDELLQVLQKYSAKKERTALFHQFDEVFLKLFPSFIANFNQLFPEDERKNLKEGELLNTELRIYALYRLGIQDNKQVADFLDVSISTIYSYKTRLKAKSYFKDSFESKIMEIKRLD